MNILDYLNPIGGIVSSAFEFIDDLHLSGEERALARQKMAEAQHEFELAKLKMAADYNKELTTRHQSDMASDSKLAKSIRPMSLIYLLVVVSILAITDGNITIGEYNFEIGEDWVDLLSTLTTVAFGFYFGGRSIEKAVKKKAD